MKNISFTNAWHSNVDDLDVMDNLEVTWLQSILFTLVRNASGIWNRSWRLVVVVRSVLRCYLQVSVRRRCWWQHPIISEYIETNSIIDGSHSWVVSQSSTHLSGYTLKAWARELAIIKFFIEHKELCVLVTVIMTLEQYQLSAIIKNFISFGNEIINRLYFLKISFLKQNSGDVVSERFVLLMRLRRKNRSKYRCWL